MITPVHVPDAPIVYAKPREVNKNKSNTENEYNQCITKVDEIDVKDREEKSPPIPSTPEEPITTKCGNETPSVQEVQITNTMTSPNTIPVTSATTCMATTPPNNIPVATLVTTA